MATMRFGHPGHGRPTCPLIGAAIVVMALVVPAGNTLALDFDPGPSRQITSSGDALAFQRGLARTVPASAVLVYQDRIGGHLAIFRRLTQDEGTSWGARSRLSGVSVRQAARPAVAADGMAVDVVWVEGRRCDAASCRLRIATSGDGGSTFGTTKTLSSEGSPGLVNVARRGQLVVVAWTDWATGNTLVRSSTDGAETFGDSIVLGTSRNKPYLDTRREARVTLGIGGGMVYALYFVRDGAARMRRSGDDGQTWRSAQVISDKANGSAGGSVVAGPDDAFLAYSEYSARKARTRVVTRSTVNDGSDWTPAVLADPRSRSRSFSRVSLWSTASGTAATCSSSRRASTARAGAGGSTSSTPSIEARLGPAATWPGAALPSSSFPRRSIGKAAPWFFAASRNRAGSRTSTPSSRRTTRRLRPRPVRGSEAADPFGSRRTSMRATTTTRFCCPRGASCCGAGRASGRRLAAARTCPRPRPPERGRSRPPASREGREHRAPPSTGAGRRRGSRSRR